MQAAAPPSNNTRLLIGRAGGGGESDAAFTPSPPGSIQLPPLSDGVPAVPTSASTDSGAATATSTAPTQPATAVHRNRKRYGKIPREFLPLLLFFCMVFRNLLCCVVVRRY